MTVQRCGWCITGAHADCVVVVEMGIRQMNGSQKYQSVMPKSKLVAPYFWRCGCGCEESLAAKCVQCQRTGVEVVKNRCVVDCSGIKKKPQPKVRGDWG